MIVDHRLLNPIDLREQGFQSIAKSIAKSNLWALKKDLKRESLDGNGWATWVGRGLTLTDLLNSSCCSRACFQTHMKFLLLTSYKRACVTFIFWKLLIHAAQPNKYMLAYASRLTWRDTHAHIASYSVNIHSCCFVFTHIYTCRKCSWSWSSGLDTSQSLEEEIRTCA